MTLRIEKISNEKSTVIRLIGRMGSENLQELRAQIQDGQPPIVFDLEGVTLVDIAVVRFLGACETDGIKILHCSLYIREWIRREKEETRT